MRYCEQCGHALAVGVAFCEECGARIPAPRADEAPLPKPAPVPAEATPPAPPPPPPRRWRPIAAAGALLAVAGVTVGVLLATGVIGGTDDADSGAAGSATTTASADAGALPALPARDVVDDAVGSGAMPLPRLPNSVTLVAARAVDPGSEPIEWAVYAVPGSDAAGVCREIETTWLPELEETMSPDTPRSADLGTRHTPTGDGGCAYSYTERHPTTGSIDGPLSYDIAVRSFARDDVATADDAARKGSLGAITPDRAPRYQGPYVEVSRVLTRNAPDVPYMDGTVVTDGRDVEPQPSPADVAQQIADVIAYSGRGRASSQAGDFDAAERNRRRTLRMATRLTRIVGDDSPLRDSVAWLRDSAQASLDAVLAYQACGGVACAAAENEAATSAKEAFVAEFNREARRYLGRTYVATDL